MKYVNRTVRNGVEYLYLRKRGCPAVPLKGALDSPELKAEVDALIKAHKPSTALPGTLKAALRVYELEDPDFLGLAESTKYEYRLHLTEFDEDMGSLPILAFTPAYIQKLRNSWAVRGHRAANVRLQVLKNVLTPSVVNGTLKSNPFELISQVRLDQM